MQRTKVFVCYSHEDQKWFLKDLLNHLKPLMQKYQIDVWYDQNIQPGEEWHQEIMHALQTASVAVLIVSANFFASDFIEQQELPLLLTAAEQKEVRIVPVLLSACDYKDSCLEKFQLVNDPQQPLNCMLEGEQDKVWLKVATSVKEALVTDTVMSSVSASSYNHVGEKKKILENTAYQEVLRMLNNQTLDGKKRTSTVLLLADMTEDLNEVEKHHLRGRLHRLRLDERLDVMQDYVTLVLGLLDDVTVYNDMRTIFFRLYETLPLHLQKRILECLAHQDNKSA